MHRAPRGSWGLRTPWNAARARQPEVTYLIGGEPVDDATTGRLRVAAPTLAQGGTAGHQHGARRGRPDRPLVRRGVRERSPPSLDPRTRHQSRGEGDQPINSPTVEHRHPPEEVCEVARLLLVVRCLNEHPEVAAGLGLAVPGVDAHQPRAAGKGAGVLPSVVLGQSTPIPRVGAAERTSDPTRRRGCRSTSSFHVPVSMGPHRASGGHFSPPTMGRGSHSHFNVGGRGLAHESGGGDDPGEPEEADEVAPLGTEESGGVSVDSGNHR